MKAISTQKVLLINDREGLLEEFIQIDITIDKKDDVAKTYTFKTVDSLVLNKGLENESTQVFKNRHGVEQIKFYTKTYEEYDTQKELLKQAYPSELVGSELDDYLLLCGLLYNLEIDPVYGVGFVAK
jgi:hypothetical protein